MADFSDNQDAVLVRLVRPYLQQQRPIQWDIVVKRMRFKTKSNKRSGNVSRLSRRHTASCSTVSQHHTSVPVVPSSLPRDSPLSLLQKTASAASHILDLPDKCILSLRLFFAVYHSVMSDNFLGSRTSMLEKSPWGGVTMLLKILNIGAGDTFGDIGCAIGNVLVQVALESSIKACIGVEVREELVVAAQSALFSNSTKYPELLRVSIYQGDICNLAEGVYRALSGCSVVLVNNIVFEEQANLALEQFLCMSTVVSQVVLGRKMCPRHRSPCGRVFCLLWDLVSPVQLEVKWASDLHEFYLYRRALLASF